MIEKEMLVGLSTAAARRIVKTGKFADGSKASASVVKRLKESYNIKASPKPKAEPKTSGTGLPKPKAQPKLSGTGEPKKSQAKSKSTTSKKAK
jgi:hypothetical protein